MSERGTKKRVVLGVGERAKRYDLGFPRLGAVYVVGADEAAEAAAAHRVVGALVTGNVRQIVVAARELRSVAPAAFIAALDPGFTDPAIVDAVLRGAGVDAYDASWLRLQPKLADGLKPTTARRQVVRTRRLH
jgi:hypothetical protein